MKAKARLVFPTCLCLNNFSTQEETYHWQSFRFFERGHSEAGQDRRVVARRYNHCVSRFLMLTIFYLLIPVFRVMGPTGSGKSTVRLSRYLSQNSTGLYQSQFISLATGFDTGVGHTLESCTSEIKIVKLSVPELSDSDVVFVDTPGFDDTHKSDSDILKMVADWLKSTCVS